MKRRPCLPSSVTVQLTCKSLVPKWQTNGGARSPPRCFHVPGNRRPRQSTSSADLPDFRSSASICLRKRGVFFQDRTCARSTVPNWPKVLVSKPRASAEALIPIVAIRQIDNSTFIPPSVRPCPAPPVGRLLQQINLISKDGLHPRLFCGENPVTKGSWPRHVNAAAVYDATFVGGEARPWRRCTRGPFWSNSVSSG